MAPLSPPISSLPMDSIMSHMVKYFSVYIITNATATLRSLVHIIEASRYVYELRKLIMEFN